MFDTVNIDFLQKYVQNDYEDLSNLSKKISKIDFYMNELSSLYSLIIHTNNSIKPSQSIYLPNSRSKSITTALDFFYSIDNKMYQEALKILSGQGDIPIQFHYSDYLTISDRQSINSHYTPSIKMPHNTFKIVEKNFTSIHINLSNSLEDLYALVHEISHTFTVNLDISLTDIPIHIALLQEVLPFATEQIFQQYLLNSKIITPEYAVNRDIMQTLGIAHTAKMIHFRLALVRLFKQHGALSLNILMNNDFLQKRGDILEKQYRFLELYRDLPNQKSLFKEFGYVLADTFVNPFIANRYNCNPQATVSQLKKLEQNLKSYATLDEILKPFGLNVSPNTLSIVFDNKRLDFQEKLNILNKSYVDR